MRALVPRDADSYSYTWIGYANPHAVTSVGGTTYTYDNNGNVTAIGSLDYTWDWRNRLASAERSGGGITTYGAITNEKQVDDTNAWYAAMSKKIPSLFPASFAKKTSYRFQRFLTIAVGIFFLAFALANAIKLYG
jgi:hypothetical protein